MIATGNGAHVDDMVERVPYRTPKEQMQATMLAKYDQVFTGHTYDLVRVVHLPEGQVFQTIFGRYGRHGYIIRDRESGQEMVVGFTLLRLIHDRYLAVSLPRTPPKKRPKRPVSRPG